MFFIFEGPDGAGKTSAIRKINERYPEIKHRPRFATSEGGPLPAMDDLIDIDVSILHGADWTGDGVYDRHGLISELVYGPILRHALPGRFNDEVWLRTRIREVANRAVVIWCLPPLEAAEVAMWGTEQMLGVADHYRTIYAGYQALRAVWPGHRTYTYDYTADPPGDRLAEVIKYHIGKE
jgi:hypothetical protein